MTKFFNTYIFYETNCLIFELAAKCFSPPTRGDIMQLTIFQSTNASCS